MNSGSVLDPRDYPVGWTQWLPDKNHDFVNSDPHIRDDPTDPTTPMSKATYQDKYQCKVTCETGEMSQLRHRTCRCYVETFVVCWYLRIFEIPS